MVPAGINVFDVDTVEEDLALLGVVEALDHGDDGGLAAARGAAESDDSVLGVLHLQRDTLQHLHLLLGGVGELNVFQLDAALNILTILNFDSAALVYLWLVFDNHV